jgi:hypothetical protein
MRWKGFIFLGETSVGGLDDVVPNRGSCATLAPVRSRCWGANEEPPKPAPPAQGVVPLATR